MDPIAMGVICISQAHEKCMLSGFDSFMSGPMFAFVGARPPSPICTCRGTNDRDYLRLYSQLDWIHQLHAVLLSLLSSWHGCKHMLCACLFPLYFMSLGWAKGGDIVILRHWEQRYLEQGVIFICAVSSTWMHFDQEADAQDDEWDLGITTTSLCWWACLPFHALTIIMCTKCWHTFFSCANQSHEHKP